MVETRMMTSPRPLPGRRPVKWGGKVKWTPVSFRFPPDLYEFLKKDAEEGEMNVSYLVVEIMEQYRAFKTVKKRSKR